MIKTALIGHGFSAKYFHIPFIQHLPDFQLVAISTSNCSDVDQNLSSIVCYQTADELIQMTVADLIIITAPNFVHFSLAQSCLLAGKHVVLEKPMVTTIEEGEILMALAKKKSLLLTVYHNRRWDGDFLTIKKMIKNKSLGEVRLFESHFDRFRPEVRDKWKELAGEGTGVWFDLGSHLLDQVVQLFGTPQGITARCLCLRESSKATDYFHVQLHYEGLEVSLQSSPYCAHQKLRFRVEGTKGSYYKYHFDPQEADLLENISVDEKGWGKEPVENYGTICTGAHIKQIATLAGSYSSFYQGVADTIRKKVAPPVEAKDALFIVFLLRLAEKSSEQGETIWL